MNKNNLIVIGLIILGIGLYGLGYSQATKKANIEKTAAVTAAEQKGKDEGFNSATHLASDASAGPTAYQNQTPDGIDIENTLLGKVIYVKPDTTTHFSVAADVSSVWDKVTSYNGKALDGETRYDCVTTQLKGTDFSLDCKKIGGSAPVISPAQTQQTQIQYPAWCAGLVKIWESNGYDRSGANQMMKKDNPECTY